MMLESNLNIEVKKGKVTTQETVLSSIYRILFGSYCKVSNKLFKVFQISACICFELKFNFNMNRI